MLFKKKLKGYQTKTDDSGELKKKAMCIKGLFLPPYEAKI